MKNADYEKAIKIYQDRVKSVKSDSEAAWINHNWGRCLLEQVRFLFEVFDFFINLFLGII